MHLTYSPLESERFNLRILRGTTTKLAPDELLHAITTEQADVAILRIPTSEQYRLSELSGAALGNVPQLGVAGGSGGGVGYGLHGGRGLR